MSIILVCGSLFICTNCQKKVRVEYNGGAWRTQTGKWSADRRRERSAEYGQPAAMPDDGGRYQSYFGLCEDCYRTVVCENDRRRAEQALQTLKKVATKREGVLIKVGKFCSKKFPECISNLNADGISVAIKKPFDPYFGDKYASAAKRNRLLRSFMHQYIGALEKYLVGVILEYPQMRDVMGSYAEETMEPMNRITAYFSAHPYFYREEQTKVSALQNMIHLITTATLFPVAGKPDQLFYTKVEVDQNEIVASLILSPDDVVNKFHPLDTDKLHALIYSKLESGE